MSRNSELMESLEAEVLRLRRVVEQIALQGPAQQQRSGTTDEELHIAGRQAKDAYAAMQRSSTEQDQ